MRVFDGQGVPILMYHSISGRSGPTAISPRLFAEQLDVLADQGFEALPLSTVAARLSGDEPLPSRAFALTFDDGYEDFATHAQGRLETRGYAATVFLPTAKVGGAADWEDSGPGAPRIMAWDTIRELADAGVVFGSHGVSHRHLTGLSPKELDAELADSKQAIEDHVGKPVELFAMPYGSTSPTVRRQVEKLYSCAVGTRLQRAGRHGDPFDLPRLDMWYFRDPRRWSRFLGGRAEVWFAARRALRRCGKLVRRAPGG